MKCDELKVYRPKELVMQGRHNEPIYLKSEADKVIAELKEKLKEQTYKRCLAMAKWCESECNRLEAIAPIFDTDKECWEYNSDYWQKWYERWMGLAEQFKEAKC